jgi:DNA-binding MarR family transcriptional regulator
MWRLLTFKQAHVLNVIYRVPHNYSYDDLIDEGHLVYGDWEIVEELEEKGLVHIYGDEYVQYVEVTPRQKRKWFW